MRTRSRTFALVVLAALLLVACSGGTEEPNNETSESAAKDFSEPFGDADVYPVFVSSELTVGSNRFIIGLLDGNDAPVNDPEIDVSVDFYDLKEPEARPSGSAEFTYVESVPGKRGVYVSTVEFDAPGKWGAEVHLTGGGVDESLRGSFDVKEDSSTPSLGEAVPPSDTLTAADAKSLSEISTDTKPNPDFYKLSIAEAVKAKRPFVVAFATPKFCASATCGPTLDIVKGVAKDFPEVNFLHVEPYDNLDKPDQLRPIPAVGEWGLPSEPWVFVVDANGKLLAKYEGVLSPDELREELSSLN
ncbi:MAG: FixH family protein [Actinomycetota bacterium]